MGIDVGGGLLAGGAFAVSITLHFCVYGGTFFGGKVGGIYLSAGWASTYITPDVGTTLWMWLLCVLGDLVFVVCLFVPLVGPLSEILYTKSVGLTVYWRVAIAYVLHSAWIMFYTAEYYIVSLFFIGGHVVVLASLHMTINMATVQSAGAYFMFAAPIAIKTAWISVVGCVNFFMVWAEYGHVYFKLAGPTELTVVCVVGLAAVSCFVCVVNFEPLWPTLYAFVFWGILRVPMTLEQGDYKVHAALMVGVTWASINAVVGFGLVVYGACSPAPVVYSPADPRLLA